MRNGITKAHIKARLRDYQAQTKGKKPYEYDSDIIAKDILTRIHNDTASWVTACSEVYLQRTAKNIGVTLKAFDRKAYFDKKKFERKDMIGYQPGEQPKIIQMWNEFFLFPLVLRRDYA